MIEVTDMDGNDFILTPDEEKFYKRVIGLEKLNPGRLRLFGSGVLSIRIIDGWYGNEILATRIQCEGGDGGDRNPEWEG